MQELVRAGALRLPLAFVRQRDPAMSGLPLIGSVMLLLIVELLNTAIEKLCDHLSPALSAQIKVVKDLGSAAVSSTGVGRRDAGWLRLAAALRPTSRWAGRLPMKNSHRLGRIPAPA